MKRKKNGHLYQLVAIFLPLNSSISSKQVFMAVSDFGAETKKKSLKSYTCGSIFPTPPRQRSNSPSWKGLTSQISPTPGTECSQMSKIYPGQGMLRFRVDRRISYMQRSRPDMNYHQAGDTLEISVKIRNWVIQLKLKKTIGPLCHTGKNCYLFCFFCQNPCLSNPFDTNVTLEKCNTAETFFNF